MLLFERKQIQNISYAPKSLLKINDKIIFEVEKTIGEKMTATIRPCLIIAVEKKYLGDVYLKFTI